MRRALLAATLIATAACSSNAADCDPVETEGDEVLHLYVSNQSFEIDPVMIEVYIDDQPVVCEQFAVEGQHNWILFEIPLDAGEHSFRAVGNEGTVEINETIDLAGERWAVIDFWWYPGDEAEQLTFDVYDHPIAFA